MKHLYYLGDILEVNGGSEMPVRKRIKVAWDKWEEFEGIPTNKYVPGQDRQVYLACVRGSHSVCW